MRAEDAAAHLGDAGRAIMGTQVRIGDDECRTVPTGEVGEILIQGPHVMREYWRKPEATAETVVDGWLRSGDLGLQDAEGFLKVVDRTKDMLISGGINVYPAEIEKALAGVAGVVDLAVIGVPDERWGEVPMVVFHATRPAGEVIAEFEAIGLEHLAGFKRPRLAVVSDEPLPRTFSGKLNKPTLRKEFPTPPDGAVRLFESR
jgi:acyl-CoA synthetase (AMP-forming)/AMP-acid ligase II